MISKVDIYVLCVCERSVGRSESEYFFFFFFFFFFLTNGVWNLAKCNAKRLIPTPEIY